MGHFIGIEEKSFYVDEGGRVWNSPDKRVEHDPVTYEAIPENQPEKAPEKTVDEETEELQDIRRLELFDMNWSKLRKLHRSVTGIDERSLKKPEIVENIIKQEFS
jgi:hypothetical protein